MKVWKVLKYIVPIIFLIAFMTPTIIYFVTLPKVKFYLNIIDIGQKTEAKVIDSVLVHDDEDDDDENTYKLRYVFVVDGKSYFGTTQTTYSRYEAHRTKYIYVFYDADFNSVEEDYTGYSDGYKTLCVIFSLVSLGAAIVFVVILAKDIRKIITLKKGIPRQAKFLRMETNTKINHIPFYKIHYYWLNDYNERLEGVSPSEYTCEQASYFMNTKVFDIKTKGQYSVIVEKPFQKSINNDSVTQENSNKNFIKCEYCGTTFDNSSNKCPNCGAPLNNDKKDF